MPHVLTYDTLPAHSNLRREIGDGGATLTILAPAQEVGPALRRAAARSSAPAAAMISLAVLAALSAVAFPAAVERIRRLDAVWFAVTMLLIGVFAGALFLLVWWVTCSRRLELLDRGLAQQTAIVVARDAVLVESRGPLGDQSLSMTVRADRPIDVRGGTWEGLPVPCLELWQQSRRVAQILPARDEAEFRWVAAELARAIGESARANSCSRSHAPRV